MNSIFASRLKMLREEHGLSQSDLADKIGVSRGSISFYENKSRVPDIAVLVTLCNFFSVSSDYLLGLSNIRNKNSEELFVSITKSGSEPENIRIQNSFERLTSSLAILCDLFNRVDIEFLPDAIDCLNSIVRILEDLATDYDKYAHMRTINRAAKQLIVDFNSLSDGEEKKKLLAHDDFSELLKECSKLNEMMASFTPTEFAGDAIKAAENAQNFVAGFALHLYADLTSDKEFLDQSEEE